MPDIRLIIAIVVLVAVYVWSFRRVVWPWIRSMWRAPGQRVEIVSEELAPPATVEALMEELAPWGFRRLGITRTWLTSGGVGITWYMAGDGDRTLAEVIPYTDASGVVAFSSYFPDDACVETSFLIGESIRTPQYICAWTRKSAREAYEMHTRHVELFARQRSSEPRTVGTMDAVLELESLYRARYYRRKLVPPLLRGLGVAVPLCISATIAAYLLARMWTAANPALLRADTGLLVALIAVGSVMLVVMFAVNALSLRHAGM